MSYLESIGGGIKNVFFASVFICVGGVVAKYIIAVDLGENKTNKKKLLGEELHGLVQENSPETLADRQILKDFLDTTEELEAQCKSVLLPTIGNNSQPSANYSITTQNLLRKIQNPGKVICDMTNLNLTLQNIKAYPNLTITREFNISKREEYRTVTGIGTLISATPEQLKKINYKRVRSFAGSPAQEPHRP